MTRGRKRGQSEGGQNARSVQRSEKMVGTWLGEFCSRSCLSVLPGSAWVLLDKIYQPFITPLCRASDALASNQIRDESTKSFITVGFNQDHTEEEQYVSSFR